MSKISELSDGGALQSTDYLIAVRSGGNVKVQPGAMSVDINGGTIDGVTIGGSSAGAITGTTGQFNTSLNVDGTVTADGLTVQKSGDIAQFTNGTRSAYFAADSGGFSLFTGAGQTGNGLYASESGTYTAIYTNSSEKVRIDSIGNVGIGNSSPAALSWPNGSTGGLFLQSGGLLSAYNAGTNLSQNYYYNAGEKFIGNGGASRYVQSGQEHIWSSSTAVNASGAGAALTWSESMRIDSSGNVGIGSSTIDGYYGSSPANTRAAIAYSSASTNVDTAPKGLVVRNDNTTTSNLSQMVFGTLNTGNTPIAVASIYSVNDARTSGFSTGSLGFGTVGGSGIISERMRIDSSGNLLVGTTTTAFDNSNSVAISASQGYVLQNHVLGTGSGTKYTYFSYNAGEIGSITQNGTTGVSYNTSSDRRLKENITDANDAGDKIDAIKVRQYDWKADGSHQDYGMVAQELMAVAPEAVSGDPESDDMMGVDYSKLVPMMLKEIQSLRARVAQLEGV